MKILAKIALSLLSVVLLLIIGCSIYYISVTGKYKISPNKLINETNSICFLDIEGEKIDIFERCSFNYVYINDIPQDLVNALISVEDKRFFSHKGVDYLRIIKAGWENFKSKSFKQGASTITQQLVKNTHLSSEKTVKRKLIEIKLARELEKKYSKIEILEMYLNTVYYGNNCYGIYSASSYYFDKKPSELNTSECATIVALLKAPTKYNPYSNYDLSIKRRNIVLSLMQKCGKITKEEFNAIKNQEIILNKHEEGKSNNARFYFERLEEELETIFGSHVPDAIKVYTYFDKKVQNVISCVDVGENDCNFCTIAIKEGKVLAYASNLHNETYRNPASAIKPLLVYGPAINENIISEASIIKDEKTDFNGYSPKNANGIYCGTVDCKTALSKSLNIPAISILNALTVKKANTYLNKTSIKNTVADLTCALGNIGTGATLKQLAESYSVFSGGGYFTKAEYIDKITDNNGKILYSANRNKTKVFESDTAYIVCDMLKDCTQNGTAKKLCDMPYEVCAKTGTNGDENGNNDALSIAFTSELTLGVWLSSDKNPMPTTVNGSSYPTANIRNFYNKIYVDEYPKSFDIDKKLTKVALCKYEYEQNKSIVLADDNALEKDVFYSYFKSDNIPKNKQTNITMPNIKSYKISNNIDNITIYTERNSPVEYSIYKSIDGQKEIKVFDSKNTKGKFVDKDINYSEIRYSIVPYAIGKNGINYGEKTILPKIKPKKEDKTSDDEFWLREY